MVPPTIYEGTFIHNISLTELEIIEEGCVAVDEHGVIVSISKKDTKNDVEASWSTVVAKNAQNGFWFPGFIGGQYLLLSRSSAHMDPDTHIHASQISNAGIFGKTTLLSWLLTYTFPRESEFSSTSAARSAYAYCVDRTLACGTTTAAYYATTHVESTNLLADVCLEKGQRAFVGRCNMDSDMHPAYYQDASPENALKDTKATIRYIESVDPEHQLVTPIITPRFAPSCTPTLLEQLGELHSTTNLPIQTHLSENVPEIELVRSMFPEQNSYAAVYEAHGLLTSRTLFAHACHLSQAEMELIHERNAKISHCPVSNSSLASGICPVRELLDHGIDVGLGTDVSGGYSTSILVAAREAAITSRSLTLAGHKNASQAANDHLKLAAEECLFLATRGGAKCLGLEAKVGGFEVGMTWDAQYVDLGETVSEGHGGIGGVALWGWETWPEKVAKWMFCGDDRNTMAVWIGGRLVYGSM